MNSKVSAPIMRHNGNFDTCSHTLAERIQQQWIVQGVYYLGYEGDAAHLIALILCYFTCWYGIAVACNETQTLLWDTSCF